MIKQWFDSLNDSEKKTTVIGGGFVAMAILYWGILQPLESAVASAKTQVSGKEQTLQWLNQNLAKYKMLKASGGSNAQLKGSLSQLVNRSAKSYQLTVSRMQPQGDELQLWLEDSPFDQVLNWLKYLNQQGAKVQLVDITQSDKPGYVSVKRLQLAKG